MLFTVELMISAGEETKSPRRLAMLVPDLLAVLSVLPLNFKISMGGAMHWEVKVLRIGTKVPLLAW